MIQENKSIGLSIIGWLETILGSLGGIYLIWTLGFYLWSLYATSQGIDKPIQPGDPSAEMVAVAVSPFLIISSLPFLLLLILGIGLIKKYEWARKIQIILWAILLAVCLTALLLRSFAVMPNGQKDFFGISLLLSLICIEVFLIWFLTRAKIKDKFKKIKV